MSSQIADIHDALVSGKITCTSLVAEKLALLKPNTHHTVVQLLNETAMQAAYKVDEKIKNNEPIHVLEGIPFGVKDVYMLRGTRTTATSKMLKDYQSSYTATAIQKLIDAGAIPIVKENCDSFGHGSSNENTIFGAVNNALDGAKVAGGSSGGSAVNVAMDHTIFSIGGDTGGSIRQPAGYNGVYGLKPTYGRVSRYGLHAYTSSTDCVGPIAKSVEDIAIVLNAISGKDPKDATTIKSRIIDPLRIGIDNFKKDIKIGYFDSFINNKHISPKIKEDFLASIKKLESKGNMTCVPLDFFDAEVLVATYYTLAMAETASNLSRLDGSGYGHRLGGDKDLKSSYALTRSENFSAETKRRIVGGNQVLAQGFDADIYQKASKIRDAIKAKFKADFKKVDFILSPVTPAEVPEIGNVMKNPHQMYLSDAYTVGFSLGKLPTLTIPKGTTTGVQLTANHLREESLLQAAHFLATVL